MIFFAVASPMPGNASSSASDAELMSSFSLLAAVFLAVELALVDCAETLGIETATTNANIAASNSRTSFFIGVSFLHPYA
jgi:hypothetical protein